MRKVHELLGELTKTAHRSKLLFTVVDQQHLEGYVFESTRSYQIGGSEFNSLKIEGERNKKEETNLEIL